MTTVEIVQLILVSIIGLLLVVNFILFLNEYKNDTISAVIKTWAYEKYFFLSFSWGVLGGHFFFGTEKNILGFSQSWHYLILLVLILGLLIFIGHKYVKKIKLTPLHHFMLLITGFIYGHFLWSQRISDFNSILNA